MLYPNTLEGLFWGLNNFDGIEFDIRLSNDDELVIFHDPTINGRAIRDMDKNEIKEQGIALLRDLFVIPEFQELCKQGKQMFIELKPNCNGHKRVTTEIAKKLKNKFDEIVTETGIDRSSINIIGFPEELLKAFIQDYSCFPILPDINECNEAKSTFGLILSILVPFMRHSLGSIMKRMKKDGYKGVFVAREYIIGFLSFRHQSASKLVKISKDLDFKIGSNLGFVELEVDYPDFYRFSDKLSQHPRFAKEGEGPIIAHRGTGTKGVDVEFEGFEL